MNDLILIAAFILGLVSFATGIDGLAYLVWGAFHPDEFDIENLESLSKISILSLSGFWLLIYLI